MLWLDGIPIDACRSKLAVERVQIEAVRARNEGQRFRGIAAELVRGARLAGIIAGRGNASGQRPVRILEPPDVVSLPAMQRD
jgi:hypothetical protein